MGIIDEISGAFNKPVLVREVLKKNRVDISLIDWMAWLPSAYKKLKCLYTYISRKRQTKAKASTVNNEAPPVPSFVYLNQTSQMFPILSGPFRLQFQEFGTTSHTTIRAPPSAEQLNLFEPVSYYQQSHKTASKVHNNDKTVNPLEVTVAAVSKFLAPDKHTRIVSSLPKTEKAFRILCLI